MKTSSCPTYCSYGSLSPVLIQVVTGAPHVCLLNICVMFGHNWHSKDQSSQNLCVYIYIYLLNNICSLKNSKDIIFGCPNEHELHLEFFFFTSTHGASPIKMIHILPHILLTAFWKDFFKATFCNLIQILRKFVTKIRGLCIGNPIVDIRWL